MLSTSPPLAHQEPPRQARKGPISDYDLIRALDSEYSSHQISGAVTPTYRSGQIISPQRLIEDATAASTEPDYVVRLREAKQRADEKHRWDSENRYLLLAMARHRRLQQEPTLPRFDGTHHRCNDLCVGIESTIQRDLWVCVNSGNTHLCGSMCNLYMSETNGGRDIDICPLGGFISSRAHLMEPDVLGGRFSTALGMDHELKRFLKHSGGEKHADIPKTTAEMVDDLVKAKRVAQTSMSKEDAAAEISKLDHEIKLLTAPKPTGMSQADENRMIYNAARGVMHRLFFSEKRRALDQARLDNAYEKLAVEFAKHYETRRKVGLGIDKQYLAEKIIETSDALKSTGGNVQFGHSLSPEETRLLLVRLASTCATLWRAFKTHNAWGLGKDPTKKTSRLPSIEYHTLAVLYASKHGITHPQTRTRWLVAVPELVHLLPDEKSFGELNFSKAEYSKNETFFRTALHELFKRETLSVPS